MLLNADTINVVAGVVQAVLAVGGLGFAIWGHKNLRRSQEALARQQKELQLSALTADQAKTKLDLFRILLKRADSGPLQVLGELELEELGSDQSIRSTLNQIEKLCLVDPWGGKAAVVEHVDLVRFFSHVTRHEINLAAANLPAVARKVLRSGGERYPVKVYRRRSKLALVGLFAVVFLSILNWVQAANYPPHRSAAGEAPGIDSASPQPNPGLPGETERLDTQGGDRSADTTDTIPPASGNPEPGDREGIARGNEFVATQVAGTRNLMRAMNDSITRGAYVYAIGQLREARSRMEELQLQTPDGASRELLQQVISELDLQINAAMRACQGERNEQIRVECP